MSPIVARIVHLLENRGMTAKNLTEKLGLNKSLISDWKAEKAKPTVETLIRISDIFGVSLDWLLTGNEHKFPGGPAIIEPLGGIDAEEEVNNDKLRADIAAAQAEYRIKKGILPRDESLLVQNYRGMDESGKMVLLNMSARMTDPSKENSYALTKSSDSAVVQTPMLKLAEEHEESLREMMVYDQKASAGLGNYLDDSPSFELLPFKESEIPPKADYGIRISGDSMEPKILDGDIVWIEEHLQIEDGEIGIFILDGESYCKKLRIDRDRRRVSLLSLNPAYDPIHVDNTSTLRTVGRVLLNFF